MIRKVSEPTRPAVSSVVAAKVPSSPRLRKARAISTAARVPPHRLLERVAKTSASSLRKPLTSARRTRPKPRKRKRRIRKTKRTRKTTRTREIEKDKSKKILRTSAKVLIGARRRKKSTASSRKKRRGAELSTRRESNANAQNMKSASATMRLNLDRKERAKRARDKRESKRIEESRKRRNASNVN